MAITMKNPWVEKQREVIQNPNLTNKEKDKLIDELQVESSKWIRQKIDEVTSKMKEHQGFIEEKSVEVKKLEMKDVRKIYKETIKRSRDIKKLYDDMRELNKQVRSILNY